MNDKILPLPSSPATAVAPQDGGGGGGERGDGGERNVVSVPPSPPAAAVLRSRGGGDHPSEGAVSENSLVPALKIHPSGDGRRRFGRPLIFKGPERTDCDGKNGRTSERVAAGQMGGGNT